jgi:hypothetical protein
MSKGRARAKTAILAWFDKGKPTASARSQFSADIDRFFDVLEKRSHLVDCLSTHLGEVNATNFSMKGRGWHARSVGTGIVVSSVVPAWGSGWKHVFKNESSFDFFSWLGHYTRQYIHRSNISKILMVLWEREGLILDPFGEAIVIHHYNEPFRPRRSKHIFDAAILRFPGDHSQHHRDLRSRWIIRNTLDPAIHQAIFHLLRGHKLRSNSFDIESLVAYDCVLQSLQYLDWSWALGNPKANRRDLCRALGLGERAGDLAEHVYFLRNQFAAHAGGWRWWDTSDFLEEGVTSGFARLASRALRKAADIEPQHRRLNPAPSDWAGWLEDNFGLVWAAVWFRAP